MNSPKINFDAFKKDHWTEQEVENVAIVGDFVQHIMNDHDFDYILKKYKNHPYVQHNRNIPPGIDGLVKYIKQFTKRYPEFSYDVKHVYADGDYVSLHSHSTAKRKHRGNDKRGFNIVDTWKVKDGQLTEHWDAVQPIDGFMRFYVWMTGGAIRNSNGVF